MIFDELEDKPESNYLIEEDTSFTPDEIESITEYKANLKSKLAKKRSVLKGLEVGFWGITSYSLSRFLVLSSGTSGVGLAIAASILINNITNRDCLDALNIERKEGQFEVNGMGKAIKFLISTLVASLVIWQATGDLLRLDKQSKETYQALQDKVEEFNKLPESQQNMLIVAGGLLGLGGLYAVVDSKRGR